MIDIPYIFQTQVCLGLFWLFYFVFLRNLRGFGRNRFYLLSSAGMSFLIPLLSVPVFTTVVRVEALDASPASYSVWEEMIETDMAVVAEYLPVAGSFDYAGMFRWLYFAGTCVFLLRLLWQFGLLKGIGVRGKSVRSDDGSVLVFSPAVKSPFAFFNRIYLPYDLMEDGGLDQILQHEKYHVEQRHSWDALFAQIVTILFWWNPFVWLWNRSLKEVHEFQADEHVMRNNSDIAGYVRLLVADMVGENPEFVQNFNYSLIKKRIMMITQNEQKMKKGRFRMLLALPLVAAMLLLFSFRENVVTEVLELQSGEAAKWREIDLSVTDNSAPAVEPPLLAEASGQAAGEEVPIETSEDQWKQAIQQVVLGMDGTEDAEALVARLKDAIAEGRYYTDTAGLNKQRVRNVYPTLIVIQEDEGISEEAFDMVIHGGKATNLRLVTITEKHSRDLSKLMAVCNRTPDVKFYVRFKPENSSYDLTLTTDKVTLIVNGVEMSLRAQDIQDPNSLHPSEAPYIESIEVDKKSRQITVSYNTDQARVYINGESVTITELKNMSPASVYKFAFVKETDHPHFHVSVTTSEDEPFMAVDQGPRFGEGGTDAFRIWVQQRLRYPKAAMEEGIQGGVTIQFVVEKDGTLSNFEVLSSPHEVLSEEVLRVVKESPVWTAGRQNGKPVRVKCTLPLEFKLG